nr:helix-turn-helix transcriptional regulator [Martelella sp. HB161492]
MTEFAANLTGREREIAALILKGHSTGSIALTTGITAGTVKIHRKNLYRKLGISSQGELYHLFLHKTARLIRGA